MSIADLHKIPVCQFPGMYQFHGLPHLFMIRSRKDPQPSRVRISARAHHILAGHKLRADPLSHQNRHASCDLLFRHSLHGLSIQVYGPPKKAQLPDDTSQNRGLPRTVWPDQGNDLSPPHMEFNLFDQGNPAITHCHIFCENVILCHYLLHLTA